MWYYAENGKAVGPVEQTALEDLIASDKLGGMDFVWTSSFGDQWKKVKDVPDLSKHCRPALSTFSFACPECATELHTLSWENTGDAVKCPQCKADIVIPAKPTEGATTSSPSLLGRIARRLTSGKRRNNWD